MDPALVQSFLVEEWTSTNELPCLNTLCFCVLSEELLTRLISPELWGQARVDLTTNSSKRVMSEEIIPMAILVSNGVGEGSLSMLTVLCQSDQPKVEPSVVLLTLFQWDSHQLAIEVMKIFTNSLFCSEVLWPPLPGCSHPSIGCLNHLISTFVAAFVLAAPVFSNSYGERGKWANGHPITKEALWESSVEKHHLSSLVTLLAPPAPPCTKKDESSQTDGALDFSTALRQLQAVTEAKSQLKQELLHKQQKQHMREDKLIAREIGKIPANATEWREKLAEKQEDLWARMWEQLDTTFREALSQVSPANSVRLLTWLLSIADNPCAVPTCSMGEVLVATVQPWAEVPPDDAGPGPESPPTFPLAASPVQACNPVLWAHTLPPQALPMSDIKASGTPVGVPSLMLTVGP